MTSGVVEPHSVKAKKRGVIWVSVLFAGALGVPLALVPECGPADMAMTLLTTLGMGVLILVWYHYDSRQHGRPLGSGFRWLVVIFGPLALFTYLVRTRGLRNGWRAVGTAVLLVAGLIFLEAFVYAIVSGLVE